MTRCTRLSLSLLAATLITACSAERPVAEDAAYEPSGQVLAQGDGVIVDDAMLDAFTRQRTGGYGAAELQPEQRRTMVETLVDLSLLAKAAQERGLDTEAKARADIEVNRITQLASLVIRDALEHSPVSDAEIQAAYDERYTADGEEYKARHILLESAEDAEAVIAELDGGADFATLAQERSSGPSSVEGGDLGWFEAGRMVPAFTQAVMELEDGAYSSAPVETRFGWHVILREDSRAIAPPSLDTVRDQLNTQLEQDRIEALVNDMRDRHGVTVDMGDAAPAPEAG